MYNFHIKKTVLLPDKKEIVVNVSEFEKGDPTDIWDAKYPEEDFILFEIKGEPKIKLATYRYAPKHAPKAVIIYFHGMGGYMAFSAYLAKRLSSENYVVVGYDYRGHGKSEGKRFYIKDFSVLINDSQEFINKVHELYPNLPLIIGGSSLGGCIAYHISLSSPDTIRAAFYFAPALKPIQSTCTVYSALIFGCCFPCCGVSKGDIKLSCKSAMTIEKTESDQYVNNGSTPLGTIRTVLTGMRNCEDTFQDYKTDFIIFTGKKEEKIVDTSACDSLIALSSSKEKKNVCL